ncbi:MAG TPA: hypothetical protein VNO51_16480, partial [Ilumatobacteraceae bacterium]|nr:hypothetical protein [Ilumatobacteraceae bacterium]
MGDSSEAPRPCIEERARQASDAVDSTDALVFLGGANLGAAVYEYGVARLTGTYLDARLRRSALLGP